MGKRQAKRRSSHPRPSPRRVFVLIAALVGLGLCAAVVNRQALRALYYAHVPLGRLVELAARAGDDRQLLELAAARLLETDRPAEARALLGPHVAVLGDQAAYRTLIGRACLETGSVREAYAHLKVAIMVSPDYADAHWWLAETLRKEERDGEAASHDKRVTELEPGRGEPWLRLGARALKLNQYKDALDLLDRAEERLPVGEVARLRARVLWKLGRLREAQTAARAALAREPTAASQRILGQVLAAGTDSSQWREAVRYLRLAAEREPRDDEVRRDLGLLYRQLGDPRDAVKELRIHLRLNPGAVRSYLPLAHAYQALGKRDLADAVLRIYRRLEPIETKTAQAEYRVFARRDAPEARVELARTYAACGFEDRARQELRTLLVAHPGYAPARKLLATLPDRRSLVIEPLPPDPEADS